MPRKKFPQLAPKLFLAGLEPFATGGHRRCYVHPEDPDLCVKVPARVDDRRCRVLQRRELNDYEALRSHGSCALFDRIPAIEGVVDTDLGIGIVSQLCRDADGQISRNLAALVSEQGLPPTLVEAIDELKQWLKAQRLLTHDTGPHNVVAVCLSEDKWKLVIIESWVNRRYQWLARYHRAFADHMIGRQLSKFDRRLAYLIAERSRHS